jgi:hypothetical protein
VQIAVTNNANSVLGSHYFKASRSGIAKSGIVTLMLVATLGLAGMALINVLPSYAAGNPYIAPTLSLSPNHGPTGTVVVVTGAGFSPGVTITITDADGVITVSPSTITTTSSGGFTASVTVVTGMAAQTFVATGSDIATVTGDHASAKFAVTNINESHSTTVRNNGGSATVNDTSITGISVVINGLGNFNGAITVTTADLSSPDANVGLLVSGSTPMYLDIDFSVSGGTLPAGATATICFTNPGVTSGMSLSYWNGTAWTSATNITTNGSRICGTVPASALTGTNFGLYIPVAAAAGFDYVTWGSVAAVVIIVVVGLALFMRRRGSQASMTTTP